MMRRFFLAVLMSAACGLVTAAAPVPVPVTLSELEKLLEAGQYVQFQSRASVLAEKGNPEAQFLLGKAYHLGRGVDRDWDLARRWYQEAAEQNHARATHNLGLVLLEHELDAFGAIEKFERAKQLGLTTPTMYNLGLAHKSACVDRGSAEHCDPAAEIFMSLWDKEKDTRALDEAVVVRASQCFNSGSRAAPPTDACKTAIALAEKGAALGLGRSAYNRGAIEHDAKRYGKALPWFKLAVEHGEGLGAYSLGDMYEKALGVERDDAEALVWFKRGAVLKNAYAVKRMVDYWENKVRQADNQAGVKAAMTELAKLEPKDAVPHEALGRLKTMDTLAANAKALPALAGKPIDPTLCPLTKDDYNLFWWIVSLAAPGDAEDEQDRLASGNVNAKGCLTLNPGGLAAVRKTMALGNTPVLHWAGQGRLLSLVRGPGGKLKFVAEVTGYTE